MPHLCRLILLLFLAPFIAALAACGVGGDSADNKAPPPAISFYYWKTTYDPGSEALERLREVDCGRLYLRFFEVTLDEWQQPAPHATVNFIQTPTVPVAPVIYFDLKVFTRQNLNVERFAKNLTGRVLAMAQHHGLELVKELHIGCDWTASTREQFFAFTAAVRQALPSDWQLVITLRLDQVKNFHVTGIPTGADRGVLMAYNMGNLRQPGAHNSIIDPAIAATYLKPDKPYPLPLDVALPLFEWVVVFDVKDSFVGLLRTVPPELFDEKYCRYEGDDIYTILRSFETGDGWPAQPGFRLRLETSRQDDLLQVAGLLSKVAPNSNYLIFYHLDDALIKEWPAHELEDIARNCR